MDTSQDSFDETTKSVDERTPVGNFKIENTRAVR